jgi:hypothetical protein
VVDSKELPKRPKVLVRIPDTSEVNTVITRLRKQNPELNTSDLLVMSRKVTEKEQTLAFSIDPDSHKALAKSNSSTHSYPQNEMEVSGQFLATANVTLGKNAVPIE